MTAPPLPDRWIAAIHARLALAYGERFAQLYGATDPAAVRQSWAQELRFVSSAAITYALDHLPPDHPPNVLQFRALCQCMPKPRQTALIPDALPAPNPDEIKRLQAALGPLRGHRSPRAWADDLERREKEGEKLTLMQRNAWRVSVRHSPD